MQFFFFFNDRLLVKPWIMLSSRPSEFIVNGLNHIRNVSDEIAIRISWAQHVNIKVQSVHKCAPRKIFVFIVQIVDQLKRLDWTQLVRLGQTKRIVYELWAHFTRYDLMIPVQLIDYFVQIGFIIVYSIKPKCIQVGQ